MGLNIKKYNYPYTVLLRLREFVCQIMEPQPIKYWCGCATGAVYACQICVICRENEGWRKKLKFHEFIYHSDCKGEYIRGPVRRSDLIGNLTKLKKECSAIKKFITKPIENHEILSKSLDILGHTGFQPLLDFIEDVEKSKNRLVFS